MLQIFIPSSEKWDEENERFIYGKEQTLSLEHSLVSISKWESKWLKPYFSKKPKTVEETIDYIKCMTITQNVNPEVYDRLSMSNIRQINEYIDAPMTATRIRNVNNGSPSRDPMTSEMIYYYMIKLGIPFECQKWHINRLLTLIRLCNAKNQKPRKMSSREIMSRNAAINAARQKKFNTTG